MAPKRGLNVNHEVSFVLSESGRQVVEDSMGGSTRTRPHLLQGPPACPAGDVQYSF